MVRRAKSLKNPFKISKIPSGYRLWVSVGILVALLVALPITLMGFLTGTFELRKRAVTGEPTPTLGPGQVRIYAGASRSQPFDQKGTIGLHINNDSSNHINLIQLFLTFDPRIIDFEGSDVELWLYGEATVKEVYDAGNNKKQLRLIYPVDFSGSGTIGLIRYTPVSVGTSDLIFENDLMTGTLENKVTAFGSEDNLIVEIINGAATISSGQPPFINAAKFDNPYETYKGYLKTQCIKTEESPSLNARQQMTIEAWIKLADIEPVDEQAIVVKKAVGEQSPTLGGSYYLAVDRDRRVHFASPYILVPTPQGTTTSLKSNEILQPGQWYHIAVEVYNPRVSLYINGQYENGGHDYGRFPPEDVVSKVSIGAKVRDPITESEVGQEDIPGFLFNGEIDEVRLSSTPRYGTSFSVPTRPFTVDSYTIALWHLDEYTGSQYVVDSSPNLNSGIIIGDVLFVPSGVESAVPTPTPTITPTPTPTTAPASIWLKVRFEGVTSRPRDDSDKEVQIYATSFTGGPDLGSVDNKLVIPLSVDDFGVYSREISLDSAYFGHHYRLRVKGPKHLQAVFPDVVFQEGVELDLTGQPLRPGDLDLDGKVDINDLRAIKVFSTDPADIALGDMNFDNKLDIFDRVLVLNTLSVHYDPD